MTTCELRLKAAEVIETRGWCQGAHSNSRGQVCALGALAAVVGRDPYDDPLTDEEAAALRAMGFKSHYGPELEPIWKWNDAPDRTKEEVIAKLREGCA